MRGAWDDSRKLKEILQDLRVSRHLRPIYRLIAVEKESLWLPGYGLSEKFKVLPESSQICRLRIRLVTSDRRP